MSFDKAFEEIFKDFGKPMPMTLEAGIELGFRELRKEGEIWIGIMPMIFTWGLFINVRNQSVNYYDYRYCFDSLADCQAAFKEWDGKREPDNFNVRKGHGADYSPSDPYTKGRPL